MQNDHHEELSRALWRSCQHLLIINQIEMDGGTAHWREHKEARAPGASFFDSLNPDFVLHREQAVKSVWDAYTRVLEAAGLCDQSITAIMNGRRTYKSAVFLAMSIVRGR